MIGRIGYHDMMQGFDPPTADEVYRHLQDHPPTLPSMWLRLLPISILAMCLVFSTTVGGIIGFVLPWFALAGMVIYITIFQRRREALIQHATNIQDQAMLRQYVPALRSSWSLIPKLVTLPGQHGQTIAAMAHCLDQLQLHEQAGAAYEFLLQHLPDSHPAAAQILLNRAVVALTSDHLADADDILRRLRPIASEHPDPTFAGQFLTARLAQMTLTQHNEDALAYADTLVDDLRPLGVDAGYGHALLALAYKRLGHAEQAATWWEQATLLVPQQALLLRYPQLQEMVQPEAVNETEVEHE